jgi:hypothetical protein
MKRHIHSFKAPQWQIIQDGDDTFKTITAKLKEVGFSYNDDEPTREITSHGDNNGGRVFVQEMQPTGNPMLG